MRTSHFNDSFIVLLLHGAASPSLTYSVCQLFCWTHTYGGASE